MPLLNRIPVLAALMLAGCAISPGPEFGPSAARPYCNIPHKELAVDAGDGQPMFGDTFSDELRNLYETAPPPGLVAPPSNSMLILSGGSQHGAFGAGVLGRWAELRGAQGGLPTFKVVTGISTGAIMATHAFLNRTNVITDSYRIEDERQILEPWVDNANGFGLGDGLVVVRRGAVGSLGPMRALLKSRITEEVLLAVASEGASGRALYTAAVDVDTGKAVVFLLSDYAKQYVAADARRREQIRDCYVDAIVASSSVPMAAPPTFIDNRMYIDGGARFGLLTDEIARFAEQIGPALSAASGRRARPAKPSLFIVINGSMTTEAECGKADERICWPDGDKTKPVQNVGARDGAHSKWKFHELAGRSVSILINQVYRFSNARIMDRAKIRGFEPRLLRIHDDLRTYAAPIDFPDTPPQDIRTCPEWKRVDQALDHPIEFHPRYMHCLMKYGGSRVEREGWARVE